MESFRGGNHPGDGIEGKKPFLKLAVFVNSEFHPIAGKLLIDLLFMTHKIIHSSHHLKKQGKSARGTLALLEHYSHYTRIS